jgi:Na+/melibiose symporter-like transporter
LDLIGFPRHAAAQAARLVPSPDTLRELALAYGPGAGILTGAALLILSRYRLGSREHATIREALRKRESET